MIAYLEMCIHDWESSLLHYTPDPLINLQRSVGTMMNNDGQVVTFYLQWEMGFHSNISMNFYKVDSTSFKKS